MTTILGLIMIYVMVHGYVLMFRGWKSFNAYEKVISILAPVLFALVLIGLASS